MPGVTAIDRYDVLVVGSGFGGSVAALRLAEKGHRVAVLEAGKRWNASDFARTNWNVRRFLWMPNLFCHGILRLTLLSDVLAGSGSGVGGGSLVYANTLPVPRPDIFAHPEWPAGTGWRQALAPHYETAKRMLGAAVNPRLTAADRVMKECADDIGKGATFHATEVAVFFGEPGKVMPDPYFGGQGPDRAGCIFCGGCMVGCRHNAKNTLDKNYLYLAEKLGVDIFPETQVDRIGRNGLDGYRLSTFRPTRMLRRERKQWTAPVIVLAAGVLGTVDLLLRAREEGWLRDLSPAVGRRVRTNSETIVAATARGGDADFTDGVSITSSIYPDDVTHIEPVRYPRGSDLIGLLAKPLTDGGGRVPRPLRFIAACVTRPADLVRSLVPFGWARRTILLLVMQVNDNSLELVRRRRWYRPWARVLDSRNPNASEKRNQSYIPIANEMARRVAKKIGGWPASSINEVLLDIPSTAHMLGGACIGSDPATAVCDDHNRVFGCEGLYVVDGSAIPVNLGVNPALTITALAEHAMSLVPAKAEAAPVMAARTGR
ncbi:MAG: GMC family oxidoreductase [Chloroflexi bacterium]|nr:MAG: GMC family oxidoreductase [Chloroflexota bacterium]